MPSPVISPVLLQRECDGGKGDMSPEEWARCIAARMIDGSPVHGCGTRFQWYWGMNCVCPKCGRCWAVTLDDIRKYQVVDVNRPDVHKLVDRVVREVLARLDKRY